MCHLWIDSMLIDHALLLSLPSLLFPSHFFEQTPFCLHWAYIVCLGLHWHLLSGLPPISMDPATVLHSFCNSWAFAVCQARCWALEMWRQSQHGSALTMVLVEGQQKRLTTCWLSYSPHATSVTPATSILDSTVLSQGSTTCSWPLFGSPGLHCLCFSFYGQVLSPAFFTSCPILPWTGKVTPICVWGSVWLEQV